MEEFDFTLMSQDMLELDISLARQELERANGICEQGQVGATPESVTLMTTSVKNQGKLGACTGFAAVGAIECLAYNSLNKAYVDLSELCNYHLAKEIDPWAGTNYSGSSATSAVKAAKDVGCCWETLKPYAQVEYQGITQLQLSDAAKRKVADYQVLELSKLNIMQALANGWPVVFSLQMYEGLYKPANGFVTLGNKVSGGHAVFCCGYFTSNNVLYFIIKNSWGESYGNKGFCYIKEIDLFKNKMLQVAIAVKKLAKGFDVKPYQANEPKPEPKPEPLQPKPEPTDKENFIVIFVKKIIEIIINSIKKS